MSVRWTLWWITPRWVNILSCACLVMAGPDYIVQFVLCCYLHSTTCYRARRCVQFCATGWFELTAPNCLRVHRPRRLWEVGPEVCHTCSLGPPAYSFAWGGLCVFVSQGIAVFGNLRGGWVSRVTNFGRNEKKKKKAIRQRFGRAYITPVQKFTVSPRKDVDILNFVR